MRRIVWVITLLTVSTSLSLAQSGSKVLGINLENYDYPYPVHFITLHSQQQTMKMAYMDVKPQNGNGNVVMLLHGKNFNGAYWRQTIQYLAANGYRVVVPDQIGFGKSTKPPYYQYTFQQLAINTKMILDSLNIKELVVVGHSMGGMLATRFALMFPEIASKLVLEDPIGLEDWKLKVPYKPIDWWYGQELKKDYQSIKKYEMESYYNGKWKPEYEEWVDILAGWTQNIDYPLIAWNAALTYDMIFTQPVVYEFNELTMPVMLMIGMKDRTALGKGLVSKEVRETLGNYPELGREVSKKIRDCTLVEISELGHLPHIENFDRFIEPFMAFLKK